MDRDTASLYAWLSGLCRNHFVTVLALRGERVRPQTPYELELLARRLMTRSSVIAALHVLPRPALQLAGALVAIGDVADTACAAKLLGAQEAPAQEQFSSWLAELMDHALVWPAGADLGPEMVRVNPGLAAQSGALGAPGLRARERLLTVPPQSLLAIAERWGIPRADRMTLVQTLGRRLADPDAIRRRVADAPVSAMTFLLEAADRAAARRRLARKDDAPLPRSWAEEDASELTEGRRWAENHGLVFRAGWDGDGPPGYRLAAETVVALMSDGAALPFDPEPPAVSLVPLPSHEHEDAASAAAAAVQADYRRMLGALDVRPAALLRRRPGGVGVRELRRVARESSLDEATVRLFLEVGEEIGLLRWTWDGMAPAPAAAEWLQARPEHWTVEVAHAWPRLAKPLRADDAPRPALVAGHDADAWRIRKELFGQVCALPAEHGFHEPADLSAFLRWRLPLVFGTPTDARLESAWWEATRLGILVGGGLTPFVGSRTPSAG